jgi:uncharacterized LabA/DUF88 family protein
MPRSTVYIDGYNWYHAIFKHHPEWKWLNVQRFFETLRPDDEIISIKMFSAMLPGEDAIRQTRYFDALRTLPKVSVVLGVFQERVVTCKANGCRYVFYEEKKTDVNIAVHMMADAFNDACDCMYVVSGDSDIQPAVEWVSKNKPIKVTVYIPALIQDQAKRRLDYYQTAHLPVVCKFLPLENIKQHQFPNVVQLGGGKMCVRPHVWQ